MLSLILSALCLTSCSERIDAGSEGILVNLYGSDKGVDDVSLVTGRVWYNPFTEEVYEYPTFVQTIDYPAFTINAKDGSEFTVDPTVSLKMVDGNAPRVFKKYRKGLNDILKVRSSTTSRMRSVFSSTSTQLIRLSATGIWLNVPSRRSSARLSPGSTSI